MKPTLFAPILITLLVTLAVRPSCAEPREDTFFSSDGVRLHYVIEGRGNAVVLLHGLGQDIDSAWRETGILEYLAETFEVIALDMRGHGQSDKPHDPEAYGEEMVEDVSRLLDLLGWPQVHMVGYSVGGLVALKFLEKYPGKLQSLVVGGAGLLNEDSSPIKFLSSRINAEGAADGEALAALLQSLGALKLDQAVTKGNTVVALAMAGADDPLRPTIEALDPVIGGIEIKILEGVDHETAPASLEFRQAMWDFFIKACKCACAPAGFLFGFAPA